MSERILAVAVHPDDESLSCGGTLLKHQARDDELFWLILTSMKPEEGFDRNRIESRAGEIRKVHQEYGFQERFELDLTTTALDTLPMSRIVAAASKILEEIRPTVLYLPFSGDVHSDHRIGFEAVYSASKSFRHPSIKKILMGETVSESEFAPPLSGSVFSPNYFVDISDHLEKKLEILRIYQGELGDHPFPRSEKNLKALAAYRGARCGVEYAEAFMLLYQKV